MILVALDPGVDFATAKFIDGLFVHVRFQDVAGTRPDVCAYENPVPYSGGAPAKSVVRLGINCGRILERIHGAKEVEVSTVAVPKYVVERNVRRVLSAGELAALERDLAVVPEAKRHNCFDSIRHGLVHLGRLSR